MTRKQSVVRVLSEDVANDLKEGVLLSILVVQACQERRYRRKLHQARSAQAHVGVKNHSVTFAKLYSTATLNGAIDDPTAHNPWNFLLGCQNRSQRFDSGLTRPLTLPVLEKLTVVSSDENVLVRITLFGVLTTALTNLCLDFLVGSVLSSGNYGSTTSLLPGSDSIGSADSHDSLPGFNSKVSRTHSTSSRPSNDELNRAFKFGGYSKTPSLEKPIALSDIIPPPSRIRAVSNASYVDDSVIDSIMAKASDLLPARTRVNSDSSIKRRPGDNYAGLTHSIAYRHSRHESISSFDGFDGFESFEEVRRGLEFHDYRPSFYPPPVSSRRNNHGREESVLSFASISSYGHVVNPGIPDPFD